MQILRNLTDIAGIVSSLSTIVCPWCWRCARAPSHHGCDVKYKALSREAGCVSTFRALR